MCVCGNDNPYVYYMIVHMNIKGARNTYRVKVCAWWSVEGGQPRGTSFIQVVV